MKHLLYSMNIPKSTPSVSDRPLVPLAGCCLVKVRWLGHDNLPQGELHYIGFMKLFSEIFYSFQNLFHISIIPKNGGLHQD